MDVSVSICIPPDVQFSNKTFECKVKSYGCESIRCESFAETKLTGKTLDLLKKPRKKIIQKGTLVRPKALKNHQKFAKQTNSLKNASW